MEAVAALQSKAAGSLAAAYNALAPEGRFKAHLAEAEVKFAWRQASKPVEASHSSFVRATTGATTSLGNVLLAVAACQGTANHVRQLQPTLFRSLYGMVVKVFCKKSPVHTYLLPGRGKLPRLANAEDKMAPPRRRRTHGGGKQRSYAPTHQGKNSSTNQGWE